VGRHSFAVGGHLQRRKSLANLHPGSALLIWSLVVSQLQVSQIGGAFPRTGAGGQRRLSEMSGLGGPQAVGQNGIHAPTDVSCGRVSGPLLPHAGVWLRIARVGHHHLPRFSTTTLPPTASTSSSEAQTVSACLASALSASATQGLVRVARGCGCGLYEHLASGLQPARLSTTAWFDGPGEVHLQATVTQEVLSGPIATVTLSPGQKAATTVWTDNPDVPSQSLLQPCECEHRRSRDSCDTKVLMAPIGITVCSTNNSIGTTPITAGTAQSPILSDGMALTSLTEGRPECASPDPARDQVEGGLR